MNDIPQILFVLQWLTMVGIAISMMAQGWKVSREMDGYTQKPQVKRHPEIDEMEGSSGTLMTVKISGPRPELPELDETDADFMKLQERINEMKQKEDDETP